MSWEIKKVNNGWELRAINPRTGFLISEFVSNQEARNLGEAIIKAKERCLGY